MFVRFCRPIAAIIFVCLAFGVPAFAKDGLAVKVDAVGSPVPIVINENGNTPGTIQVRYDVIGTSVNNSADGYFAQLQLTLTSVQLSTQGQATDYGTNGVKVNLTQDQSGASSLILTADPASVWLKAPGQTGSSATSMVTVQIPPALNGVPLADGTDLVGNLKFVALDQHFDTPTNLQVHVTVWHPTTDCFRAIHLVADQGYTAIYGTTADSPTPLTVTVGQKGNGDAKTTPSVFADTVVLINSCTEPKTYDVHLSVASGFSVPPGNSVFTATNIGSDYGLPVLQSATWTGGKAFCLGSVVVPAGTEFFARVHTSIDMKAAGLAPTGFFVFPAALYPAGATCSGSMDTDLTVDVAYIKQP